MTFQTAMLAVLEPAGAERRDRRRLEVQLPFGEVPAGVAFLTRPRFSAEFARQLSQEAVHVATATKQP